MANRQNTLLLKRSNIIGKIPPLSGLTLGEMALNTADAKLYSLYTSGSPSPSEVRQIGWDRISRTGDTVFGDFEISGSSLPSGYALSVTGDTNFVGDIYVQGDLNYDGNLTVSGTTFLQGLSATTISATTIGTSGDCIDDIYVSNIHSCSPLNINPLNEGNVYFGSTSAVTIDLTNNRVGIGTPTPVAPIEIYSNQPNVAIPNQIKFSQAGGNIKFAAYDATISDFFGITLSTSVNNRPVRVAGSSGLYVGSTTAVPTPAGYILVEGNVGIGLSGTTAKLHINNTTSGNTFLAEDNTNPDSSPFVIDASGNTVIGTTTPQAKLDVRAQGNLSTDIAFRVRNSGDTGNLFAVRGDSNIVIGDETLVDRDIIYLSNRFIRFQNNGLNVTNWFASAPPVDVLSSHKFGFNNNSLFEFKGDSSLHIGLPGINQFSMALRVNSTQNILEGFRNAFGTNVKELRIRTGEPFTTTGIPYNSGNIVLQTGSGFNGGLNGDIIFQISSGLTEVSRITSTGLGIGTSTPRESLDVSGNTIITGNLTVSGITGTTWFSGNSSSDLVRVTQTGSGNAFVVEDNTNPDSSPFVIDVSGNTGIGVTTPTAKLQVKVNDFNVVNNGFAVSDSGNTSNYFTVNNVGQVAIRTPYTGSNNQFLIRNTNFAAAEVRFNVSDDYDFSILDNQGYGFSSNPDAIKINTRSTNGYINLWTQAANTTRLGLGGQDINPTIARTRTIISPVNSPVTAFVPTGGTDYSFENAGVLAFQPTGGTATYTQIQLRPSYNTTGAYSGTVRGLYYNPILTSLVGATHRAIETTTGDVIFGSTSGNVGIGTITPREKLDVNGNTIISSGLSASTVTITTQPTSGYTSTQILMRNSTSGQVEITDSTSPSIYNYGMSYAMTTFNYLT